MVAFVYVYSCCKMRNYRGVFLILCPHDSAYASNLHHLHVESALTYSRTLSAARPDLSAGIVANFAVLFPSLDHVRIVWVMCV